MVKSDTISLRDWVFFMNSWKLSLIYSLGKNAGLSGESINDCPHVNGERRLAWMSGFKAGQYAKDKAL